MRVIWKVTSLVKQSDKEWDSGSVFVAPYTQQLIQHLPSSSQDHPLLCLLVDAFSKLCFSKKSCPDMCVDDIFMRNKSCDGWCAEWNLYYIQKKTSRVSVVLKNQMAVNSLWGEKWSALWVMALLGQINGEIR